MSLDIFNPIISTVPKGIEGKTMLWYGSNRVGKTLQATQAEKPYYLAFEKGINAIPGIPFAPIQKWGDFIKVNKALTNPTTLAKAKEMYQTLIVDTTEMAGLMCSDYICQKFDAESIASGNRGYGLWSEYSNEWRRQINLLTSAGYTIIFISHEGSRTFKDETGADYDKIYPKGDKRIIDPVCDLVDIIVYLKPNGLNEKGEEIPSSAFLVNTSEYHAGSRFTYLPKFLQEFSMDNMQKAIGEAISKQEANKKGSTVDYSQFKKDYEVVEEMPFDELVKAIGDIAQKLYDLGRFNEYEDKVTEHIGKGVKVSEAKKSQQQVLEVLYAELKEIQL